MGSAAVAAVGMGVFTWWLCFRRFRRRSYPLATSYDQVHPMQPMQHVPQQAADPPPMASNGSRQPAVAVGSHTHDRDPSEQQPQLPQDGPTQPDGSVDSPLPGHLGIAAAQHNRSHTGLASASADQYTSAPPPAPSSAWAAGSDQPHSSQSPGHSDAGELELSVQDPAQSH